jgi:hypothetical protein
MKAILPLDFRKTLRGWLIAVISTRAKTPFQRRDALGKQGFTLIQKIVSRMKYSVDGVFGEDMHAKCPRPAKSCFAPSRNNTALRSPGMPRWFESPQSGIVNPADGIEAVLAVEKAG